MALTFTRLEYLNGTAYELCGRSQLIRVLHDLKSHFGLDLRLGIAFDFKLSKPSTQTIQHGLQEVTRQSIAPLENNLVANNSNSLMTVEDELLEVSHILQVCGVTVSSYTKGTQSGQFRMTLKTEGEDSVRATENYSIAKMTLKRYFQRKGVEVTYVPCEPDIVGSK